MYDKISNWLCRFFPREVVVVPPTEEQRELTRSERRAYGRQTCKSKIRYASKKEAWKWAIYYFNVLGTKAGVYRCHYCEGFHLSKKVAFTPSKHIKKQYNDKHRRPLLRKNSRSSLYRGRVLPMRREPDRKTNSQIRAELEQSLREEREGEAEERSLH